MISEYENVRINWQDNGDMVIRISAVIFKIGKEIELNDLDISVGGVNVTTDGGLKRLRFVGLRLHGIDRIELIRWIEDQFKKDVTKKLKEIIELILLKHAFPNSKKIASMRKTL